MLGPARGRTAARGALRPPRCRLNPLGTQPSRPGRAGPLWRGIIAVGTGRQAAAALNGSGAVGLMWGPSNQGGSGLTGRRAPSAGTQPGEDCGAALGGRDSRGLRGTGWSTRISGFSGWGLSPPPRHFTAQRPAPGVARGLARPGCSSARAAECEETSGAGPDLGAPLPAAA